MRQVFGFLFVIFQLANSYASINVLERGDFEKAQLKAREENKLLFLDFYASWCGPCQWMDETTFKDQEVLALLNQNYVAVKVNIDDFEGFELKSKFDIRYLPTMLIFNQNGVLIERVEETLGAGKLKNLLSESTANNKSELVHAVNTSPKDVFNKEKVEATPVSETVKPNNSNEIHIYRIQLGVFASVQNAIKMQKGLKKRFTESIEISEVKINGKVVYKVLFGKFNSLTDAESYQLMLKNQFKMDSIIL